jgi:UDP-N-acetylglucosamine--N-acetylmuramyl-(pentapeptide) pyrophosphoryl-undecaprenol N-acetylglucosamine transferase
MMMEHDSSAESTVKALPQLLQHFFTKHKRMPNVVLTGGGTGGHLYPALAIADVLLNTCGLPRENLHYIGNENSLEADKVPKRSIYFYPIQCSGMPRGKNPITLMRWFGELSQATLRAGKILKSLRADVVLGTGGYVAAPVLLAAKGLKIPFMVHESDAIPGLVNRLMAPQANAVSAAFENANQTLKVPTQRFFLTGNPIDPTIGSISKEDAYLRLVASNILPTNWDVTRPTLLVLGGSQGAQQLNDCIVENLERLIHQEGVNILHQCGAKHEKTLQAKITKRYSNEDTLKAHYKCLAFLEDMPAVWGLADYALCRSGSMSLAEMLASSTPAILIPYPYASQNHQEANAKSLVNKQAALMILDSALNESSLFTALHELKEHQTNIAHNATTLAKPLATYTITKHLLELVM